MQKECSGPLFPYRPRDLASVKYPAVARIGESSPIIPTVYTYGKHCGPYYLEDWCTDIDVDVTKPSGLHVYESRLWYLMAEYPNMVFATIIRSNMAYVGFSNGEQGIMFLDKYQFDTYSATLEVKTQLQIVGYTKTCPKWLGPCIYPYYLYADVQNHILYPGNYSCKYEGDIEVVDNPPISMYKRIIDDNADWVAKVNGVITTFKKGGV